MRYFYLLLVVAILSMSSCATLAEMINGYTEEEYKAREAKRQRDMEKLERDMEELEKLHKEQALATAKCKKELHVSLRHCRTALKIGAEVIDISGQCIAIGIEKDTHKSDYGRGTETQDCYRFSYDACMNKDYPSWTPMFCIYYGPDEIIKAYN